MAGKRAGTKSNPAGAGCLIVIIAAVLIGGGVWAWNALFTGPGASYRAQVTGHTMINPATLAVTVRVTNTGKAAGTPACQINASDPGGAYTGADLVTLKGRLAPGATTNFADPGIVITGQGAQYVTSVTVSCS